MTPAFWALVPVPVAAAEQVQAPGRSTQGQTPWLPSDCGSPEEAILQQGSWLQLGDSLRLLLLPWQLGLLPEADLPLPQPLELVMVLPGV